MLRKFPPEIIKLLFSYVSNYHLQKLANISSIQPYVINELYKIVHIGPPNTDNQANLVYFFDDDIAIEYVNPNFIPTFSTVDEFITVVNSHPSCKPNKIELDNCLDLVMLSQISPWVLINTKIVCNFCKIEELDLEIQQQLLDLLNNSSCIIESANFIVRDHFVSFEFGHFTYVSQILQAVKRVNFNIAAIRSLICHYNYCNVHSLTITSPINNKELIILPKHFQYLSCSIIFKGSGDGLDFPHYLKILKVSIMPDEHVRSNFDISYLGELTKLEMLDTTNCQWTFPSSLLELSYNGQSFEATDFNVYCPELFKFVYYNLSSTQNIDYSILLPTSLIELETSSSVLNHLVANNDAGFIRFSNLRSLSITEFVLSNIDLNQLKVPNLQELTLCGVDFRGKLPNSIRKLSITGISSNKIIDLRYLTNLEVLQCMNLEMDLELYPIYMFSSSLRYLALINSNIERIKIVSDNLTYLSLKGNNFSKVNDNTLVIPTSVTELNLSLNGLLEIDPNFRFPFNLSTLVLNHHNTKTISNFLFEVYTK